LKLPVDTKLSWGCSPRGYYTLRNLQKIELFTKALGPVESPF